MQLQRELAVEPSGRSRHRFAIAALLIGAFAIAAATMATITSVGAQVDSFTFKGSGWGHGVGMSQHGARAMAADGHDASAILAHYYGGTNLEVLPTVDDLRVHLSDSSETTLSSSGPLTFTQGGVVIAGTAEGDSIRIHVHDGGLQIGPAWAAANGSNPVLVSFPQPVRVSSSDHSYLWGKLQLTVVNGKVRVVESALTMENYIAGIAEMPSAWPQQALQAQAIAARTYALEVTNDRRGASGWTREYDISATTTDQHYIGYDAQDDDWDQPWLEAQAATAGVVISYAGQPIRAYYSSSSGGHTETADFVFSNPQAFAPGVPDPYDQVDNEWSSWTRTYSVDDLSRWINRSRDINIGRIQSIEFGSVRGISGRTDKTPVTVVGTEGTLEINGRRLMLLINAGVLGEGGGLSRHLPGTLMTIAGSTDSLTRSAETIVARTDVPAPTDLGEANRVVVDDVRSVPLLDQTAARLTNAPFGRIDLFGNDDGWLTLSGWAIDPDVPTKPVTLDLYIDGIRTDSFKADRPRPDLADHFPAAGPDHSFHTHFDIGSGEFLACVMARDVDGRSDEEIFCAPVQIAGDGSGGILMSSANSDGL